MNSLQWGVEDTSAKDIAWEDLKLAEPDYRALESRRSCKEQQSKPYHPPLVILLNSLPGCQHVHE